MNQEYVCSITPTEFEKHCLDMLRGYAESGSLQDFSIEHNVKIPAADGTYQIDVYAAFTALGVRFKVLCECKQYSHPVNREKVAILHAKLNSIGAQKGILLSTAPFQSGAIEYAQVHGIALLQVSDIDCVGYSYSPGPRRVNKTDPHIPRKRMPPYVVVDCTANAPWPKIVYPPMQQ